MQSPKLRNTLKLVLRDTTDMATKAWSPSNILDVFADPVARALLLVASEGPVSVNDIADSLDVSNPTVYRRIDALIDANLLTEYQRIDPKGNQHKEYETILDEITFSIEDQGYTVEMQVDQDLATGFESLWSDLEATGRRFDATQPRPAPEDGPEGDPI